ncbi:hypothetical protein PDJAM_G00246660 [Pangasius djambal]|uniref:Uncharacterized protein n=1 Tax=Pangasius djambal TaxID=1691987 RepID=A0ACC5YIB5_9TELE|nr:hypothetical protein [Pangasius djambal]
MPQLNGGGGDELGANDEMISFKDEGEQEEKTAESVSAERDLDDVKSSLVNESENNSSSSDSEPTERRPQPRSDAESYEKARECFNEALRRQQDGGGLFKSPHYPGYPFLMLPDLASPYLPSGALSPTARTHLIIAFSGFRVHTLTRNQFIKRFRGHPELTDASVDVCNHVRFVKQRDAPHTVCD